jgi:hypothetical protein
MDQLELGWRDKNDCAEVLLVVRFFLASGRFIW